MENTNKKQTSFDAIGEINRKYSDPSSPHYMAFIWREKAIAAINNKSNNKKK